MSYTGPMERLHNQRHLVISCDIKRLEYILDIYSNSFFISIKALSSEPLGIVILSQYVIIEWFISEIIQKVKMGFQQKDVF